MDIKKYFHKNGKFLEIGPLDKPFLKKTEYNVKYLDYNNTEGVKAIYKNTYANYDSIVDIDYATFGRSYKEAVGEAIFDGVYSSHVIEHTLDLLAHFRDVADILCENGVYYLVLPDKTHYADYFRQNTTFREVYEVYKLGGVNGIVEAVADAGLNVAYNFNTKDFHNKEITFLKDIILYDSRKKWANDVYKSDNPELLAPSCHKWVFDEKSILEIIRDAIRFELIPFSVEEALCTSDETNFNIYIAIRKNSEILSNGSLRLKVLVDIQKKIEQIDGLKSPLFYILDNIKSKSFYIYGAGIYGVEMCKWLESEGATVKGFIISDNQEKKKNDISGLPVYKISEVEFEADFFVVVAVRNAEAGREIGTELKRRGMEKWKDYVLA